MAFVAGAINPLNGLCPGRDTWKVKVRVLRSWEMYPIGDSSRPYALNIVLIDSQGCKIEAIVKRNLILKFRGELVEGNVYKILYFHVAVNSGSFRATDNQYKIYFNGRTKISIDQGENIPRTGLTLKDSSFVEASVGHCDFLIDFVGVLTAISKERKYVKGDNITRKIELELTDDKGKVRCALFGNYVDMVNEFMSNNSSGLPIVVIQFAKIKLFREDVVIQNVMNATKLYWDAEIPEISTFRDGIAVHGIDFDMPIGIIDDGISYVSLEDEFLNMFPSKNITELQSTHEEGMFIVCGNIKSLFESEKWWYTACRCHKSVSSEDGLYFCDSCSTYVLEVTPRFRIKVEVSDGFGSASFVLFDSDCQQVLQKSCKDFVIGSKGIASEEYPEAIKSLIGRKFLFKVQKCNDQEANFDDSFKVKKLCEDMNIIELFNDKGNVHTPEKLIKRGGKSTSTPEISGELSDCMSEVAPSVISLDDISPGDGVDGSASCSSLKTKEISTGHSYTGRGKRLKFTPAKLEKK